MVMCLAGTNIAQGGSLRVQSESQHRMSDKKAKNGLVDVVDDLDSAAEESGGEDITLGQLLDKVGNRSHGALILVPALIALLPTGGIPTVPTIMAALIFLIAVQIVVSPDHIWLPEKLKRFSIGNTKFRRALQWFRPWAQKFSWLFRSRLTFVNKRPFLYLIVLALLVMACTMPPLEFLPFAAAMPSFVMTVIGLGLTMDDGLWTAGGLGLAILALGGFLYLFFTVIPGIFPY